MEAIADSQKSPPAQPLGQLVAAERERQGLSRADVAQRLHMSAWQVEALETGDYERLPKGPFLRGFVRNYTKLLGLNAQAALDALAAAAPNGPAPRIVVPSQNIRFDPLGDRYGSPYVKAWTVAGVVLALAAAAMYWWVFVRPAPPAATPAQKEAKSSVPAKSSGPAPQNLAAAPVQAPEVMAPRDAPKFEETAPVPMKPETSKATASKAPAKAEPIKVAAKPEPAKAPPKPEAPVAVRSSPASAAPVDTAPRAVRPPDVLPPAVAASVAARPPGTRTVTLRFKGSAWVEIKDRSGKVLLSKVNDPGSEAEVSGRPPFFVVVGNAPEVTMLYDDREFPLEPHTKVAVARFTLE